MSYLDDPIDSLDFIVKMAMIVFYGFLSVWILIDILTR